MVAGGFPATPDLKHKNVALEKRTPCDPVGLSSLQKPPSISTILQFKGNSTECYKDTFQERELEFISSPYYPIVHSFGAIKLKREE